MRIKKWLPLAIVSSASFIVLVWFFGIGGFIAGIFETLFLLVLVHPNEAIGILASTSKILRGVHFWFEKTAVEKRLESTISLSSKKLNEEGVEILPHGIDIKWVESKDREAFLREDKIVVCLEPSQNEARNLARATLLYASTDLIRDSQRFVDHKIMKSACFAVSRKMLMLDGRLDAFRCLTEEFLEAEIAEYPAIKKYLQVMESLDSVGLFTRLMLNELLDVGVKLALETSSPRAERETRSFMETMKALSEKKKGVDVNPTHRGQVIDCGIMLIAREGVADPSPYIAYAKHCWDEGLPRFYVLARGRHVKIARGTVLCIQGDGTYRLEKESELWIPHKGGGFPSYVAVLSRTEK